MGLWSRLRHTLAPSRHHDDIDDEIAFHLAMRAQAERTARDARLRFGNPAAIREDMRAAGSLVWLESLGKDVAYAVRQLRRSWVLTAAVILTLVIGIGANTAMFGLVDAALLKSLPVREPQSLYLLQWTSHGWPEVLCDSHTGNTTGNPESQMQGSSFSPLLYRRLAAELGAAAPLVGFSDSTTVTVTVRGRGGEEAALQYVSGNYFEELGVAPVLGRPLSADDDRVGREVVVVISHRLWQRLFGGTPDVLGRPLRVNGTVATVVGVAPARFFGLSIGEWVDVFAPLAARMTLTQTAGEPGEAERADGWWVRQLVRVRPGEDPDAMRQRINQRYQQLVVPEGVTLTAAKIPALTIDAAARGYDPIGSDDARALWILLLLVCLVLLIVCANVANLLLARAVGRQRESAVRAALGAGRVRLFQQQLVESLLLAATGGVLGLMAGLWLATAIDALLQRGPSTRLDLTLDVRMLGFTAAVSMIAAVLFGLAPAIRMSRADVQDALKAHGRSVVSGHLRLPRLLVAVQIALCLTVLVAAGLLGRSLANLRLTDVGFDRTQILYASVNPWRAGLTATDVPAYLERLRAEVAAIPGVARVSAIRYRPLAGGSAMTVAHLPGRPYREDGRDAVLVNELGDGLVETLGLRLLAGRSLDQRDMREDSRAVLVDEIFAARFYPGGSPVGQRFGTGRTDTDGSEIVGVIAHSRFHSLRERVRPTIYRPLLPARHKGRDLHVVVRTRLDSSQLAHAVAAAAARVNPDVPVTAFASQSALIDRMLRTERLLSVASRAFSGIALTLAAVGLGGLLIYAVTRRTNEIGVRMAMGAAPGDVARMVLRDSAWLVAAGVLAGIPGAVVVARLLRSLLVGVAPTDFQAPVMALVTLVMVAMLAAWLPARRAATIDPMAALRED
jgi:predicted permease